MAAVGGTSRGCVPGGVGHSRRVCGLGDAAAARGVRACDGTDADAGVLPASFRDVVEPGAERKSAGRRYGSGAAGEEAERDDAGRAGFAVGGAAGGAGVWELYLTAISAGGSRPEQAGGAVQGQDRFLCRVHSRGAPDGRVADAVEREGWRPVPQSDE